MYGKMVKISIKQKWQGQKCIKFSSELNIIQRVYTINFRCFGLICIEKFRKETQNMVKIVKTIIKQKLQSKN